VSASSMIPNRNGRLIAQTEPTIASRDRIRPEPACSLHLRVSGAQQVETGHGLAHQSDSGQTATASTRRKAPAGASSPCAVHLLETPFECAAGSQHLPPSPERSSIREGSEQSDRVVEGVRPRQPVGELKIGEAVAPHFYFELRHLFMMTDAG